MPLLVDGVEVEVAQAGQEDGVALADVQDAQAGEGCADLIHRGSP